MRVSERRGGRKKKEVEAFSSTNPARLDRFGWDLMVVSGKTAEEKKRVEVKAPSNSGGRKANHSITRRMIVFSSMRLVRAGKGEGRSRTLSDSSCLG
jgi:hypothetical protein